MDYEKSARNLLHEAGECRQYKKMAMPYRVFAFISVIPFWIPAALCTILYYITSFFHNVFSASADYLEGWLKRTKSDVRHLTEAVLYLIAVPTIFFMQVILSFFSFIFFIIWFLMQCNFYIATLGGIKWQPYISKASYGTEELTVTTNPTAAKVFSIINLVLFCAVVLTYILKITDVFAEDTIYRLIYDVHFLFSAIAVPLIFTKKPVTENGTTASEGAENAQADTKEAEEATPEEVTEA